MKKQEKGPYYSKLTVLIQSRAKLTIHIKKPQFSSSLEIVQSHEIAKCDVTVAATHTSN
jgi:hypothetical protein